MEKQKKIMKKFEAAMERFDSEIESLRIFVYTIKQYCLKFANYQSKKESTSFDFLREHEEKLRQEFVDKIEALLEERFRDKLLSQMKKGRTELSDCSDDEIELDLETQVFVRCMDDCLELCSDYISIFENKQFWNDIAVNHRKTIWMQS